MGNVANTNTPDTPETTAIDSPTTSAEPLEPLIPQSAQHTVLVVDDIDIAREIAAAMLEDSYTVLQAANGQQALDLLRSHPETALVVLDVQMPVMNGHQVLAEMLADQALKSIPVIVATADDSAEEATRCLTLGAAEVVHKPLDSSVLQTRVRNLIRLREAASTLNLLEHDRLTGLYTREAFTHYARQMMDAYPNEDFDLVMADVQNFRQINQTFGEKTGDELLRLMGKGVQATEIAGRVCGRWEGDKFAVLALHRAMLTEAELIKQNALITAMSPVQSVVVKYGLYPSIDKSLSINTMCDNALSAIEEIKHRYGVVCARYDEGLADKRRREVELEAAFENAIDQQEFEVWYQPKMSPDGKNLIGAEALVRWRRNGEMVSPGEFIPLFEQGGHIGQLDQYVFERVCENQRAWLDLGFELPVSVNCSRVSLLDAHMPERYLEIARQNGVPLRLVSLEVTESAALESNTVKQQVDELFRKGFLLDLDDFGSGYSSLVTLNNIHFDVVKLDKRLIDFIGNVGGDLTLAHTIELAHELNMRVVAEGVETEDQLVFLKQRNVDAIQGYYFYAPMPREKMDALLKDSSISHSLARTTLEFSYIDRRVIRSIVSNDLLPDDFVNDALGPLAAYAVRDDRVVLTSANQPFLDVFSVTAAELEALERREISPMVAPESRDGFFGMFAEARTSGHAACTVQFCVNGARYNCSLVCLFVNDWSGWSHYYAYLRDLEGMLELEEKAENYRNIAQAMAHDSVGAYLIDLQSHNILMSDLEHLQEDTNALVRSSGSFEDAFTRFVDAAVYWEDRPLMHDVCNMEYINEQLDAHGGFSTVFRRVFPGNPDPLFSEMTVLRAGPAELHQAVAMFRKIETQIEQALALARPEASSSIEVAKRVDPRLLATLRLARTNSWIWNLKTRDLQVINATNSEDLGRISPLLAAEVAIVPNYPNVLINNGRVRGTAINMLKEYEQKIYHAENGERVRFRIPFTTMDDDTLWLEFRGEVYRDADGTPDYAVGLYRNVSREMDEARSQDSFEEFERLQAEKQRYLALINGLTAEYTNVFFANLKQDIYLAFRLNDEGERIGGRSIEQISSYRDLICAYVDEYVYADDRYLWDCLLSEDEIRERFVANGGNGFFNINYRTDRSGELEYCQAKIANGAVGAEDASEIVIGLRNIDAEFRRQQKLERESKMDGMTGLLNRRGFDMGTHRALASETTRCVAFLFLDLDNFKNVNDTFGHAKGDEAIKCAAAGIREVFRFSDPIGRYGGDEFCVLLLDIPEDVLVQRLEQCLKKLAVDYVGPDSAGVTRTVHVTTSIGVAYHEGDADIDSKQLADMADAALYEAKENGRNRYVIRKM